MSDPGTHFGWKTENARLWVFPDLPCLEEGGWKIWLEQGEALLAASAAQAETVVGHGRNPARRVGISGFQGVWRRNRHGGFFGSILGDRFLGAGRLESEVVLSRHLRDAGVSTPKVLLALAVRSGPFWRQHLVTEEILGAPTVFELREQVEPLRAAHELMERVFDLGLWAPDLHPGNLLWEEESGTCHLLDLAGARLLGRPLTPAERQTRRDRFSRFIRKHGTRVPRG